MEWFEESRFNDPKRGGYGEIEIGNVQRADIDDVAEQYNVEVVYREGKAEVYGSTSSEIKEFMKDVESSEKTMNGSEHPTKEFGVDVNDPFSALENDLVDKGERTVTDGGTENYPTLSDISHTPGKGYDGVQKSMERGEEVMGIPLAGFPSSVETTSVKDSESYMGSF